jgi:hypothetical protein
MTLANLFNRAAQASDNYNTASIVLTEGVLYCSIRNRASNSRGPRRGRHTFTEYRFRSHDEKYSKKVTQAEAEALMKEG